MTASTPTIVKIKFDTNESFGSLRLNEWKAGYSQVSLDQLISDDFGDDSTFLVMFLSSCAPKNEFNEKNILSVKASTEGIVEKIYGPVIQTAEDGSLIIRSGGNIFPLKQDGRNFIAGELEGELEGYELKIKAGTADERTISIPRIDFIHKADSSIIYSIRVLTKEGVDGEVLKQLARSKKDISSYLTVSKSGSGSSVDAFKITEIPEGEYQVQAIDITTGGDYGNSYLIIIGDKGVWANKSLKTQLDKYYEAFDSYLKAGKPLTLRVANIRDLPTGYKTCDSALFRRETRAAIAPGVSQSSLPPVGVKAVLPEASMKSASVNGNDNALLPF